MATLGGAIGWGEQVVQAAGRFLRLCPDARVFPLGWRMAGGRVADWTGKVPHRAVQSWAGEACRDLSFWSAAVWDSATGYGVVSDGFLVVDVDGRLPAALQRALVDAPRTWVARTPRGGGWRYVYRLPDGWAASRRAGDASCKVLLVADDGSDAGDVRVGEGFYFAGPGSAWWDPDDKDVRRVYAWPREWSGLEGALRSGVFEFAPAPAALLDLFPPVGVLGRAGENEAGGGRSTGAGGGFRERWPLPVPRGRHDAYLAALVASLRRRGFPRRRAYEAWLGAVAEHLDDVDRSRPFGELDFARHWRGAAKYGGAGRRSGRSAVS